MATKSSANEAPWNEYVDEASSNFGLSKAQVSKLRRRCEDAFLDEIARKIAERAAHDWTPGGTKGGYHP